MRIDLPFTTATTLGAGIALLGLGAAAWAPVATSASALALPAGGPASVNFLPDHRCLTAEPGLSLLELAEANGVPLEAGCRMGICGADPVAITEGMECTSPISADEQTTLERLGLADNTRLACCVRVSGPVTVSLKPEKARAGASRTRKRTTAGTGIDGRTQTVRQWASPSRS